MKLTDAQTAIITAYVVIADGCLLAGFKHHFDAVGFAKICEASHTKVEIVSPEPS